MNLTPHERLLYAAPELLEALLRCLREIQPHHIPGDVYEQAQQAIAKAEGK